MAAFSTVPLLGHEAGIEPDAEVLRDGRPAHLEMSRTPVDGAGGLDEVVGHPAACGMADCSEDIGRETANHHHAANIRKRVLPRQAELSFAKGTGAWSSTAPCHRHFTSPGHPPVRYGAARGCQEGHIAACPFLRSVIRCSFRSLKRIRYNCRTPSRFDP